LNNHSKKSHSVQPVEFEAGKASDLTACAEYGALVINGRKFSKSVGFNIIMWRTGLL